MWHHKMTSMDYTVWTCLICFLVSGAQGKSTVKTYWTSILNKAIELSRNARWNEFIEEEQAHKAANNLIVNKTSNPNQSLIDETKDPSSPYYIAMISSNIGGNHNVMNRTGGHNSSTINHHQPESITKLFSYDFPSGNPSRVMHTTKRPLFTYINVSSLDEHDSENMVKYNVADGTASQLSLLNSAPGLQMKRRMPECATQQVCSAHYVKSNHTQRLCECPGDFNWNCEEVSQNEEHIIDLTRKQEYKTQRNSLGVNTQVKLCENLQTIKPCKTPTDWTIMALQSERTGKAHYVVVCKCPESASFEGPFTHKHPPYAKFPGIRVYGMLCNQGIRKSKYTKALEIDQNNNDFPEFPWELAYAVINSTTVQGLW